MHLTPDCYLIFPDIRDTDDDDLDPACDPSDYRPRAQISEEAGEPEKLPAILLDNEGVKQNRMMQGRKNEVRRHVSLFAQDFEFRVGMRVLLESRYGQENGTLEAYKSSEGLMCNEFELCLCLQTETAQG